MFIRKKLNQQTKLLSSKIKQCNYKTIQFFKTKLVKVQSEYNSNKIKEIIKIQLQKPKEFLESSQDWLENKVKDRQNDVLLIQSQNWAKSITWSLIGGTTFGIIWLSLAKTEEIVIAQGILEPINSVIEVQIPVGGIVEEILIEEGDLVSKNDILLKLNNEMNQGRFNSTEKILELNKDILKKFKSLVEEGAISELQFLQQEIKVAELESKYIDNQVSLKFQNIKAPISGKIFDLKPTSKGFVGTRSEPILKIVPEESLAAKIEINSNSIGFIKPGMTTDISIDSFPASDFGVIQGTIKSIGSDALSPDPSQGKGYRFPATIILNSQTLKIKKGTELPLQAGMSLTANVKLRKVSYLQLLLGTFQDKAESLREI